MKYVPSINIESGIDTSFEYIVTPNAMNVVENVVSNYQSGIHSFSIIGTYGTGKSSFLMALERDLTTTSQVLIYDNSIFSGYEKFEFLNILGDYSSLSYLLTKKLKCEGENIFSALKDYYDRAKAKKKFVFIVIDEFGKILEHAANNNPEQELYFLQKLAEFVNLPSRNIILLTTLHQNFGAYSTKLDETQRNEWMKVKGRFKDIVFSEPIEQLLFLASQQIGKSDKQIKYRKEFDSIYDLAYKVHFISSSFSMETAENLYPLDPFSATSLTKAIQRYGQNERTLFSFLTAKGAGSLEEFIPKNTETYNLAYAYDYITNNFFTAITGYQGDSVSWSAMKVAIERTESGIIAEEMIENAVRLVKAIGMLNHFGNSGIIISKEMLLTYAQVALLIKQPEEVLLALENKKIVRYAKYKSQYILFDGTDINIEQEMSKAAIIVPKPTASVDELSEYIEQKVTSVVSEYYKKGTPRYFVYTSSNEPDDSFIQGEIDGFVNMVFPLDKNTTKRVIEKSLNDKKARIYAVFNNTDEIVKHLHEIKKMQYLLKKVVIEDRVAKREILNQEDYERKLLNAAINSSLIAVNNNVSWFYKGVEYSVTSILQYNRFVSKVCSDVFSETPVIKNELFNKQKISSAISSAKANLFEALIDHYTEEDLGFDKDKFPPEKTIYFTLLKDTGIHRLENGNYMLGAPTSEGIMSLWNTCEKFLHSTIDKPRKLTDLLKILRTEPYKLKQGVLDFWLPIYLFVKRENFAMYTADGAYVMDINKEVLDLLQKHPGEFSVRAFSVDGANLDVFKTYRMFLHQNEQEALNSNTFAHTFKPFLRFYRQLNEYAKNTKKFDNAMTAEFRDVLAEAKDPQKAFFEDIPASLGYRNFDVKDSQEFMQQYLQQIRRAVHELVTCYDNFIDRIEVAMIKQLSLPEKFEEYKTILEARYKSVKRHLLTPRCRIFLDRIIAPSETKKEFFEKVGNAILDKRLDQTKDNEEEYLLDEMSHLFREIERYVAISEEVKANSNDEVYNFELASTEGNIRRSQTYRMPIKQKREADDIEKKLHELMSKDKNLNVCVLLRLLNKYLDN
jgi:hypothetical protein